MWLGRWMDGWMGRSRTASVQFGGDTVLLVGRSLQLMLPARRTAAHQTVAVASSAGRAVLGAAVDGNTAAETYLARWCCRSRRTRPAGGHMSTAPGWPACPEMRLQHKDTVAGHGKPACIGTTTLTGRFRPAHDSVLQFSETSFYK
jgi:hypothetical protein